MSLLISLCVFGLNQIRKEFKQECRLPIIPMGKLKEENSTLMVKQMKPNALQKQEKTQPISLGMSCQNCQEGKKNYTKYLGETIKYPPLARQQEIEGNVLLWLVVNKAGELEEIKVLSNPDQQLTDQALRVVNIMPNWIPGRNEGEVVTVGLYLPIRFQLD